MLKGNYSKYRTMTMQNKREIITPTMSIQGSEIESTEKLNLLGVTIESKLNFNYHINNVCKKASQMIGVLTRLKNLIPTEAKLLSYHTLLIATSPGTSARQAIGESFNAYKKEDSGQFLRTNILATRNYWQKQTYHRYTTDDCRTLPSSCFKIKHELLPQRLCNLFQLDSGSY